MFKRQICYSSQWTFEKSTVNLSAICKLCAKIACCSSDLIFTYLDVGCNIQNVSQQFVSCIHLYFVNSVFHQAQKKKQFCKFKQLSLGNYSELDTWSYELLSHNIRYYHLPKYWPFPLNHPVDYMQATNHLREKRSVGNVVKTVGLFVRFTAVFRKPTNKFHPQLHKWWLQEIKTMWGEILWQVKSNKPSVFAFLHLHLTFSKTEHADLANTSLVINKTGNIVWRNN
jgi:hypothetical protein